MHMAMYVIRATELGLISTVRLDDWKDIQLKYQFGQFYI